MANPYGNIAGASAQSKPGWQERLVQMVQDADTGSARSRNSLRRGKLYAQCDPEMLVLTTEAARLRGMTTAAYIRRAVAAFIAHDLEMPFEEVTKYAPMPLPFGKKSADLSPGKTRRTTDDGTGFGSWEVKGSESGVE